MYKALPAAAAACLLALAGMSPALAGPPPHANPQGGPHSASEKAPKSQPGPPEGQICPELDSGKIDVSEGIKTLKIEAPDGMVIDEVCVKAGSVKQGLGADMTSEYAGQDSALISYPGGKDISHYSVSYKPVEDCGEYNGGDPCEPGPEDPYAS